MPITAKSDTKSFGFSTKFMIVFSEFSSTTPKASGRATCLTQITASASGFRERSARISVSAYATTVGPSKISAAHIIACPVPKGCNCLKI